VTATDGSHEECIEEMIQEKHQIKQKDIALKLEISKERVSNIIKLLEFRRVFARWVP
jgi:Mn-dependent DtxR family transcriptional regulator